jgi:hypothetical protein
MPFTVLPPDVAHKVLGVLMTLTGNYKEQKEYVIAKMVKRRLALAAYPYRNFPEITSYFSTVSRVFF